MKYESQKEYVLNLNGLIRSLPIIEIEKEKLWIASFVMLGDTKLNKHCAEQFSKILPNNLDYLVTLEAKSIPLVQSICEIINLDYIVLRKSIKSYMKNPLVTNLKSITTNETQKIVIDDIDVKKLNGKNVGLIDDVISTGGSYRAMLDILSKTNCKINFAGAVLREGNFDLSRIEKKIGIKINYLANIPIFEL